MIRTCYNQRADDARYRQLSFVMLGVASPSDLIDDKKRTPFNIGTAIELQGFQLAETAPLQTGLQQAGFDAEQAQTAIQRVLYWTGGQPFLTQKLCDFLSKDKHITDLDRFVEQQLIAHWQTHDDPPHFQTINDRILTAEPHYSPVLLGLYQQVQQHTVKADGSELQLKTQRYDIIIGFNPC